jgi:hypothetical protein
MRKYTIGQLKYIYVPGRLTDTQLQTLFPIHVQSRYVVSGSTAHNLYNVG